MLFWAITRLIGFRGSLIEEFGSSVLCKKITLPSLSDDPSQAKKMAMRKSAVKIDKVSFSSVVLKLG